MMIQYGTQKHKIKKNKIKLCVCMLAFIMIIIMIASCSENLSFSYCLCERLIIKKTDDDLRCCMLRCYTEMKLQDTRAIEKQKNIPFVTKHWSFSLSK